MTPLAELFLKRGDENRSKPHARRLVQQRSWMFSLWECIVVPIARTCCGFAMRIIARHTLVSFMKRHPETKPSVERWHALAKAAAWKTSAEVQSGFPKAKVLNGERVRFEIAGGNTRMIVAFDFPRQIAFIEFVGTHAEYDGIDALSVSVS